jgi:glycerophosphoryl diester phosphodiesterase
VFSRTGANSAPALMREAAQTLQQQLTLRLPGRAPAPAIESTPMKPWVVAHRGASATIAEHTLSAYLSAIDSGADALECDVRLTRDGHLVCVHDRTVDRTSDGRGPVSALELTDLSALDFSSWRSDEHPGSVSGSEPDRISEQDHGVLTLRKLLEVVVDSPRPIRLLIETKHPTRYAGMVEHELSEALRHFGLTGKSANGRSANGKSAKSDTSPAAPAPITVMSFAPLALRRLQFLAPNVPRVLLMSFWLPGRRAGVLPASAKVAGPGIQLIRADPGYVQRAHERGNRVFVWTVDTAQDVDICLDAGVDAIITNRPAEVRARVDARY